MSPPQYWYNNPEILKLHWRRGTLTYLLALTVIGALSLCSHFLVQSIVSEQEATARIVNMAGRQRMLSQRITRLASEFITPTNLSSDPNFQFKQEYADAILSMETVHQGLSEGSSTLQIPKDHSAAVEQIFNRAPIYLSSQVSQFIQQAKQMADSSLPIDEKQILFFALQRAANHQILKGLDTLVRQYQLESETAITTLQNYNRLSLMGMFLTLLMEALLIFRPLLLNLYRREMQYHDLLKTMENEISERVRFQMFHDPLTGLPNRTSTQERIHALIDMAEKSKQNLIVISIGLDRLRVVNNSFGHDAGDQVLIETGKRLANISSDLSGHLARISSDEFVLLLCRIHNNIDLVRVLKQLTQTIAVPHVLNNNSIQMSSSLGLAIYPDDGHDAKALLLHANQAMQIAKNEGGNCFRFFQQNMTQRMTRKIKLEQDLRHAMNSSKQLMLYYQPQINLETGKVSGVEALLRWNHPDEGMLSPVEFIPIAEESGLIVDLGDWVIVHAMGQIAEWKTQGITLDIAVNISIKQLMRRNISERIHTLAEQMNIPAHQIQIEITESYIMDNFESIQDQLRQLDRDGFAIAVDDFGTGHSSLSRLRDLPVKILKIDRSFVNNACEDQRDQQIVAAIIKMGHTLNKRIIAEGIETEEQMELLKSLDCDEGQGFLFARPMPAEQLIPFLRKKEIQIAPQSRIADVRQSWSNTATNLRK